ncbi:TPA: hypothetical protein KOR49_002200 [Clostridioides difficile]|uniref:DUF7167 family protein n=1 Tax=Clostridioides difficile TaxID=1496 RepID=UPI00016C654B|nr:hypothetical protein [Clostridioides difficile]EGT3945307.1 hypothetical protein [Clostridioides difficile]MBG0199053.1 hypothetical protein [Clostridioides difficile]MCA0574397.1 hypothetical protein [Clostridioides difficile]MDW0076984.1 hypothetical protein [Clostridioides difficile]PBG25685.1 hypothetical protein BGU81_12800 [Clostridioides difficile]
MKINICVKTNKVGSECEYELEIDDDDLKDMSEEEREEYINKIALDYALESLIDWNWYEIEG